jgi:hypothetical protein
MAADGGRTSELLTGMCRLEDELTEHLERANELGRRVKRAHDAVEEQLRLTRRLAEELRGAAHDL